MRSIKALPLAIALVLSTPAIAQETTSSIRGTILSPSGAPLANQTVTIVDTRTGARRTAQTNAAGTISVPGLRVGGPYRVMVDSDQYGDQTITDVFLNLGDSYQFSLELSEVDTSVEEVLVTATQIDSGEVALGPSTSFSLQEIEALPTISRQLRDIVRVDPRVNIGRAAGGQGFGISCLGGSGRSNSFTIDGIRSADGFGLNASGNSARNTFPIPFDTLASASVEFSPIDVQYGQFTGCNLNVVTKSGSNELNGSLFYLFNDDSLTGDELEGDTVITEPFEDKNWGLEIGGPIIKDKLFYYLSYEETDEGGTQNDGPIGGGFANEGDLTIEDANRIASILQNQYGRDTQGLIRSLPRESERYFGRIDWNINDFHRLEATYTQLEELNLETDDFGFGGFTFGDNFEREGTDSDAISLRVFSNWTDRFSTEFRVSTLDVQDIQNPLGGGEAQAENIPRIQIEDDTGSAFFTSGPGFFRSANDLQYQLDQIKIAGDYAFDTHTLTFGYELDSLDVFNLFVPNATGTIIFPSIDALEAGLASEINGNGSFTGDINDASADFERDIHSFYIQDEWQVSDVLKLTYGLRYDTYDSDDRPIENPIFEQRYGFRNTTSFDGLDILMPRLGATYSLPPSFGETELTVGLGVFAGGDPTVHFANAFQNFGGAIGSGDEDDCSAADLQVLNGGTFTGVPDCIGQAQRAQAAFNTGRADAVDPDFDLPSQNRFNLGLNHFTSFENKFLDGWEVRADYIYSEQENPADFIDLTLTQNVDENGNPIFLPDGRPQLVAVDPLRDGCSATFAGPRTGFSGVTTACDSGRDDQDILLTNGVEGSTQTFSLQLAKQFEVGSRSTLDVNFGYAYLDAEIGNPITSSTATSGFEEVATTIINDPELAPAQYANEENFVLRATFRGQFFQDLETSLGVFFRVRSGRPFSYVYDNNTSTTVFGDSDNEERVLLYVPTGRNDPLVDFSTLDAQGSTDDFFAFLESSGLNAFAGGIAGRNAFEQSWSQDLDLRFQQELPGPWDSRLKFFFDIENVLNLFDDDANIQRFVDNGDVFEGVPVLDAALSEDGSQFVYSNFNPGGGNSAGFGFSPNNDRDVDDSVWRIQLGVKYSF